MRKSLSKYENPIELHKKSRERLLTAICEVKSNGFTAPGLIPSQKNSSMILHESNYERAFAYFLEFSCGVSKSIEQPVRIQFTNPSGKPASYVPDFLAYYSDKPNFKKLKPTRFKVKTKEYLKKNWRELKPKFLAAMRYFDTQGWRFQIITEIKLKLLMCKVSCTINENGLA